MSEAEQIVAALFVEQANGGLKKFTGSVQELRQLTVEDYPSLDQDPTVQAALDFLEEHGFARIHRHPKLEDYVSIDFSSSNTAILWATVAKDGGEDFSFDNGVPKFPILASFQDLGSDWLHALAARFDEEGASSEGGASAIDSSSWTGRYRVSQEDTARVVGLIREMRGQIEALDLPNSEKANALAAIAAADALAAAPDPAWAMIARLLSSPIVGNLTALAALVVSIIKG